MGIPNVWHAFELHTMFVTQCLKTNGNNKTKAQKIWNALQKDIKNLRVFRNDLAHQPLLEDKVFPADDEDGFEMIIWATDMIVITHPQIWSADFGCFTPRC